MMPIVTPALALVIFAAGAAAGGLGALLGIGGGVFLVPLSEHRTRFSDQRRRGDQPGDGHRNLEHRHGRQGRPAPDELPVRDGARSGHRRRQRPRRPHRADARAGDPAETLRRRHRRDCAGDGCPIAPAKRDPRSERRSRPARRTIPRRGDRRHRDLPDQAACRSRSARRSSPATCRRCSGSAAASSRCPC